MHTTCTFRRQEAWRTSISRLRLFLKKTVPKKRKKRWGSSWNTTLTKKCLIIRSWGKKRLKLRPYCHYRRNRVKTYCQRRLSGPKLRLIALITALTLSVKNRVINPRRRPSKIQAHRTKLRRIVALQFSLKGLKSLNHKHPHLPLSKIQKRRKVALMRRTNKSRRINLYPKLYSRKKASNLELILRVVRAKIRCYKSRKKKKDRLSHLRILMPICLKMKQSRCLSSFWL